MFSVLTKFDIFIVSLQNLKSVVGATVVFDLFLKIMQTDLYILFLIMYHFVVTFQDQFSEYMFQQALKLDYKILLDNKSKFVLVHSSSGFKHSLKGKLYIT